ncbi:Ger(x)C family spore germination protein [Paenibacillus typhae]|uniref:Spore germination protein KC n=2 Tax=Paenibacillus typhae TaxID=1174501 RepID=A0A1G9DAC9_9BACL|nr:Ger(x)C family spore germination protein [Paenibacillus typhae]SDK60868.1 spore germination protein KC [Paenibacillus typhae]
MSGFPVYKRILPMLLLLVMQSLVLTGCWSRIEINDRLLVVAMFVDELEEGKVQLTLGYAKPNQIASGAGGESPGSSMPYATVKGEGRNISDAYRNIQTNISREIFWGQVKIIVLGEEYARTGLEPLLDFVNRKSSIPLKTYILVAKGKAEEISMFPTQIEKFPSEIFRELVARKKIVVGSVKHFMIAREYGRGMILAYLSPNPDKTQGNQIRVLGSALFQDNRMIGTMDVQKTRGAMWLRGNIKDAVITFPSPTDRGKISLLVTGAKSKLSLKLQDGKFLYSLKLSVESVIDSSDSSLALSDPDTLRELESMLGEEIESRIRQAFNASREAGSDAFQLGAHIAWNYPAEWKKVREDWSSVYKERARLDIESKAVIRLLGAQK